MENINNIQFGEGNISEDPQFNDDYTLQSTSPCLDTGDPNSPLDPDGTTADMGAYYFHQEPGCPGQCTQEFDACGSVINSCFLSSYFILVLFFLGE